MATRQEPPRIPCSACSAFAATEPSWAWIRESERLLPPASLARFLLVVGERRGRGGRRRQYVAKFRELGIVVGHRPRARTVDGQSLRLLLGAAGTWLNHLHCEYPGLWARGDHLLVQRRGSSTPTGSAGGQVSAAPAVQTSGVAALIASELRTIELLMEKAGIQLFVEMPFWLEKTSEFLGTALVVSEREWQHRRRGLLMRFASALLGWDIRKLHRALASYTLAGRMHETALDAFWVRLDCERLKAEFAKTVTREA